MIQASQKTEVPEILGREYVALVAGIAQNLAGPNKTPSASEFDSARGIVERRLTSHNVGVQGDAHADRWCGQIRGALEQAAMSGDSEVGSFWDKIKSVAASAFDLSKKYGKYAIPLLPVAAATPFAVMAIQQYQKAQSDKKAQLAAAAKAVKAPAAPLPAPPPAPAAEAAAKPEAEEHHDEADSLDDALGADFVDTAKTALLPTALRPRKARRAVTAPVSKDDREVASDAGGAESTAMKRTYYFPTFVAVGAGPKVPHHVYRAAVWKKATQISGGKAPDATALCRAQKHVENVMAAKGATIVIPGATPGRVTR